MQSKALSQKCLPVTWWSVETLFSPGLGSRTETSSGLAGTVGPGPKLLLALPSPSRIRPACRYTFVIIFVYLKADNFSATLTLCVI